MNDYLTQVELGFNGDLTIKLGCMHDRVRLVRANATQPALAVWKDVLAEFIKAGVYIPCLHAGKRSITIAENLESAITWGFPDLTMRYSDQYEQWDALKKLATSGTVLGMREPQ